MGAMNTGVLPKPDSPTMATHSRAATSRETCRTAKRLRFGCEKLTDKSSILKMGANSALLHVESVAQSVAEDVQGQQQHCQESAAHQHYPGRRFHFPRALGDQSH